MDKAYILDPLRGYACKSNPILPNLKLALVNLRFSALLINCCRFRIDRVFVEKGYLELLQTRCRHMGKKGFHVSSATLEPKPAKVRKYNMRHDWRIHDPPPEITIGHSREKRDPKC